VDLRRMVGVFAARHADGLWNLRLSDYSSRALICGRSLSKETPGMNVGRVIVMPETIDCSIPRPRQQQKPRTHNALRATVAKASKSMMTFNIILD